MCNMYIFKINIQINRWNDSYIYGLNNYKKNCCEDLAAIEKALFEIYQISNVLSRWKTKSKMTWQKGMTVIFVDPTRLYV